MERTNYHFAHYTPGNYRYIFPHGYYQVDNHGCCIPVQQKPVTEFGIQLL